MAFNLVFLAISIAVGCWLIIHRDFPHPTRTPEQFRVLIEQNTSDPKLQQMFIADDSFIRSLERLASDMRDGVILGAGSMCVVALFNVVFILRRTPAVTMRRPDIPLEPT